MTSDERARRDGLVARAQAGDEAALVEVTADLDAHPSSWDLIVRLAGAEEGLIASIAGDDALRAVALRRKAALLRDEVAGPSASPLERLLAERIAMTWLQVQEADRLALNVAGRSLRVAEYYERRLDRAQRRHLAAVRSLAVVRRLDLPALQVNIGERQVNVAQVGGGDRPPQA